MLHLQYVHTVYMTFAVICLNALKSCFNLPCNYFNRVVCIISKHRLSTIFASVVVQYTLYINSSGSFHTITEISGILIKDLQKTFKLEL